MHSLKWSFLRRQLCGGNCLATMAKMAVLGHNFAIFIMRINLFIPQQCESPRAAGGNTKY